ncbi:MAG TPA: DUF58 domain-containing protein [Propionibacteriaceae bacterium]|nr:DUF58 domain-containing protein [Propionibacteriaceae bacterium]
MQTEVRPRQATPAPGVVEALPPKRPGQWIAAVRAALVRWSAPLRELAKRLGPVGDELRPGLRVAGQWLGTISGLGWTLLGAAVAFTYLGARFGWRELSYTAAVLFVIVLGSVLFAIGRTRLTVEFDVAPQRIVVGEAAAVRFSVRNEAAVPLLPLGLEFAVGSSQAAFTLPPLAPGGAFEDVAVVPGTRRSVVPIGPVTTQRGDPFGVVRREVTWTDAIELFVHPATVPLEPLGAGLLRDLEGRTTQDISMSDLAFHTLRDYVPGDDRRYIHWRSTAKFSGLGEGERFLVRQFLDTRRSHIAVVTDVSADSYRTAEEFETAISVAASIAVRALTDEMDLTVICGEHAAVQPAIFQALDTFSRAELSDWRLAPATGRLNHLAPDASVVVLVTGPNCGFTQFQQARAYLPREVATLAISVTEGGRISLREGFGLSMVTIPGLSDLPAVLAGGQLV